MHTVDLGAGRGTFSQLLRQRGLPVDCVEPDPENQDELRRLGFSVRGYLDEVAPDSLDYVFTLNVLEHVPADEGLVRQVFSRLRKGGVLFIFVPAFPLLWSRLDDHVEHQRRYRRKSMAAMLSRAGFRVERARYADSLGFFATLLFARQGRVEITAKNVAAYDRLLFPMSRFLDPLLTHFFGKNLAVICCKPDRP
jgi:SAM-dependent methyltransferase